MKSLILLKSISDGNHFMFSIKKSLCGSVIVNSLLIFLSTFMVSQQSQALTVEEAFKLLARIPADYRVGGTVCEQLARVRMAYKYPAQQYKVETGIIYTNSNGHTLGELDVVVFHRQSKRAIIVGEVKCWRNLKSAMKKARIQLQRFHSWLKANKQIHMYKSDNPQLRYHKKQFQSEHRILYFSQNGGEASGFNVSVGIQHSDIPQLQKLLIKCQNAGKCPRP